MSISYYDDRRGRNDSWTASFELNASAYLWLEAYGADKAAAHAALVAKIRALRDDLDAAVEAPALAQ